jgi:hypothetical protein
LLLLFSVLVAAAAGGSGADAATAGVELAFDLAAPPRKFGVRFLLGAEAVCEVRNGEALPLGSLRTSGPADLLRNQQAAFRTPPGPRTVEFTADPLWTPTEPDRRTWRTGLLLQTRGRPRAVELACEYTGDFAPTRVRARAQTLGSAGGPTEAEYAPPVGSKKFRVQAAGRTVLVEP